MARLCGAKAVYVSGAGSTVMAVAEKADAEKFYTKLEKGLERAGKKQRATSGHDSRYWHTYCCTQTSYTMRPFNLDHSWGSKEVKDWDFVRDTDGNIVVDESQFPRTE